MGKKSDPFMGLIDPAKKAREGAVMIARSQ
jgi:hypothetical protein